MPLIPGLTLWCHCLLAGVAQVSHSYATVPWLELPRSHALVPLSPAWSFPGLTPLCHCPLAGIAQVSRSYDYSHLKSIFHPYKMLVHTCSCEWELLWAKTASLGGRSAVKVSGKSLMWKAVVEDLDICHKFYQKLCVKILRRMSNCFG